MRVARMPRSSRVPSCGLRLQHDGAGAVAEQHAGAAVLPVEDAREGFGADDEGALELAGLEEVVGDGERVDEARAHRLHVEGRALGDAEARPGSSRAVAGKVRSGVAVAQMTRSMSTGSMPARTSAWREAAMPRSEVSSPSSAMWRCSMPVRSLIHSSLVSTMRRQVVVGHDALGQMGADAADHGSE